jgi:hypothetical protein
MALNDEMFAEAANYWDLERRYKALAEAKKQIVPHARRGLTEREKLFLRGLLCGYSPAEIARKLVQSRKGVEVYMSKTLYQYLRKMSDVPNEKVGHWRNINNLLEEAGYKINWTEKAKSKNYFPQELSVKIGNICFDSNTGTIDINIRVSIPSVLEGKITEDVD